MSPAHWRTTVAVRAGLVILAALAVPLGSASPVRVDAAPPSQITICPFTVTLSGHYRLATDCTIASGGTGITIAANDVSLILAGHNLTGPGDGSGVGILVLGASNVSIVGGNVHGFATGVKLDGASHGRLSGLTVRNNARNGIWLESSSDNLIAGSIATGNLTGIRIHNGSNNNTLTNNTATGNTEGIALGDNNPALGSVSGNIVQGNNTSSNSTGISLHLTANGNLVNGNTSDSNATVGGFGGNSIVVSGPSNTIQGNSTSGNDGTGIWLMSAASHTTVTSNTAVNNGSFYGIDVFSLSNTIQNNTTSGSRIGIIVRSGATGNTIDSNTALGNTAVDLFDDNGAAGACPNTWLSNTFDSGSVGGAGASCIS